MSSVFVLGAGASIGANPAGKPTAFPSVLGLFKAIREIACEEGKRRFPALSVFLGRFAPVAGFDRRLGVLHPNWDGVNVEELYAAIEFEQRLTDHLGLNGGEHGGDRKFYHEYFSDSYQKEVAAVLADHYQAWMEARYSGSYGSKSFPYLHENFLRVVRMELLDAVALTLGVLTERENTENFTRLAHVFQDGDTVISFNYDLLVEQHLSRERSKEWSYRTGYRLFPTSGDCRLEFDGEAPDQPSKFKVLKLHGSCNWHFRFVRGTGPGFPTHAGYRLVPEVCGPGNLIRDMRPALFLATDRYGNPPAREGEPGYFERFMIPPSTYKAEYNFAGTFVHLSDGRPMAHSSPTMWFPQMLYRYALHVLGKAEKIVFVGYSMAAADTSIRMLFRAAAEVTGTLQTVEVADPNAEVVTRIKAIIPNARSYKSFPSFGELLTSWGV